MTCVSLIIACDSIGGLEPHEYIEKAKTYMSHGEIPSAIIELKNALKKEANLPEARWLLGVAHLKIENGTAAYKEFREAKALGYDAPFFESEMLKSLLFSGKSSEVIRRTDSLEEDEPNYGLLIALRGDAQFRQREFEQALSSYRQSLSVDDDSIRARLGLARLMLLQNRLDKANQYLEEAKHLASEDENIWILLGQHAFMQKKYEDSKQAFLKAIELSKYNARARLGIAPALLKLKQNDFVLGHLQIVEKIFPNHPTLKYYQAYIVLQSGDAGKAKETLRNNLQAFSNHTESLFLLGQILYKENELEQAKELLLNLVNIAPEHILGIKLLASIQFRQKKINEVIDTLEEALVIEPNDPQLLASLGSAYISSGELEKGSRLLEEATRLTPDSVRARTQFAVGLLAAGETERAVSELNAAIKLDPEASRANLLLFMTHMRNREFDAAIDVANKLAKKQPDNPVPYNLIGATYVSKDETELAIQAFEQALKLKADFTPAMANLAKLHIRQGDIKRGSQWYKDILKFEQDNLEALLNLSKFEAEQNNTTKMLELLERARKTNATALEPRVLLGRHYYFQGDLDGLTTMVNESLAIAPDDPKVMLLLAQAQRLAKDDRKALSTIEQLSEDYPDNIDVLLEKGQLYISMGDFSTGKSILDGILKQQPNHYRTSLLAMNLAIKGKDYLLARKHFNVIKTSYPDEKEILQLEGRILLKEGNLTKAINVFEKALAINESQTVALHLANAYLANGEQTRAASLLNDWIKKHDNNAQAKFLLSSIYLEQQKTEQAIDLLKELIVQHPKHVVAMNNLAWLYFEQNNLEQANKLAQKAYELAPKSPSVMDTLGSIMIEQDKTEFGLELLKSAHKAAPESADIHYHMASALIATGDIKQAVLELNELLRKHGSFAEREEAEALLNSIQ